MGSSLTLSVIQNLYTMRHLQKQGSGRKLLSAVLIHHSGPSRHISTTIIAGVEAPVGGGASALRLSLPRGARPLRARHHQPGQGQHGILRPHLKLRHGRVLRQSPGNRLGGGYQSPTYSPHFSVLSLALGCVIPQFFSMPAIEVC